MLLEWRNNLPPAFQVPDARFDSDNFPTDRSVLALYMSYNQVSHRLDEFLVYDRMTLG